MYFTPHTSAAAARTAPPRSPPTQIGSLAFPGIHPGLMPARLSDQTGSVRQCTLLHILRRQQPGRRHRDHHRLRSDLSPFQGSTPVYCQHSYLIKQDPSGNVLYSTYFGGSSQDGATAITTD